VKGKTLGIDATTLEANEALRSIVRRDSGESYEKFLTTLAKASGIGTPTRADVARIDRKRRKKGSNDDWTHPHDPDAKITKMKDGRTHLAHLRAAGSGARMCAGTRTCLSGCSFMPAPSISVSGCGGSSASARHAASRDARP
jgi:hypothetical protein